jgi:hypothetical protein
MEQNKEYDYLQIQKYFRLKKVNGVSMPTIEYRVVRTYAMSTNSILVKSGIQTYEEATDYVKALLLEQQATVNI